MIDSHCHLADQAFEGDLDETIARATDARVSAALCVLSAGDEAEAARALRVQEQWPAVRFAAGVHPHNAGPFDGRAAEAARVAQTHATRFGACAIGEIGLDYHYDFCPRAVQRDVFVAQVQLALMLDLPIIIHTREATDDTFAVLREAGAGVRGVFHCFTGDTAMARRALDLDFHLSFAGIVTFPKAADIRDAATVVPIDRLLIETDSPYLAPVPHRGKRNEPAHVARVLEALAALRGEPAASLEAAVTRNFDMLFRPKSVPATA
jgi:TatD DNase family protein